MVWWLVTLGVSIVGAIVASQFWDQIREKVASWLRSRNLESSALMDAWIKLDSAVGAVRCAIFAKARGQREVKISEQVVSPEDIQDSELLEKLKRRGVVKQNIMHLVQ